MHILLATDADWIVHEVTAALGDAETSFTVCRDGRAVAGVVADREPDLVILDLQAGTMGGIAVTMDLRLDESAGTLPASNVLLLLDRDVDAHLAKRSGADGWLVKPLDPLELAEAAAAVAGGGRHPAVGPAVDAAEPADDDAHSDPVEDGAPASAG